MSGSSNDANDRRDTKRSPTSIRLALKGYLKRYWARGVKEDSSRATTEDVFLIREEMDVDELASRVFQQLQAVPDECDQPQAKLFDLARKVMDEDEKPRKQANVPEVTGQTRAWAQLALQTAWNDLDREAQRMMSMHVYDGCTYRGIASRLGVSEEHVLGVLRTAYATLRCGLSDPRDEVPPCVIAREQVD
jgi:DNA-directed RNA polymerase specialized sigma24 family protein